MTSARTRLLGGLLLALTLAGCGALIPAHYRITAARKDMQKGDWSAAAVELRSVVQTHPKDAEAWVLLTRLSLAAGDLNGAPAALNHALASGAKGPEVDQLRVRTWLETHQPQAALEALAQHRVALREPDLSLATARADLALGHADKSLDTLKALLAAHPDLSPPDLMQVRVTTAEALAHVGQLDAAVQQLDTAMRQDPSSPDPALLKGRILASQGQFAAAESALALALARMPPSEAMPDRLIALATLTEARLAQGEIDAAAKSQALLARLVPGAPATSLLDARIKLAHGDINDAIDELERVVSDAPGFTEARMLLGDALLNHGDLEQAQEQLVQVVQEAPDNLEARKFLAAVRLKLNEPEAALSTLTPALSSQAADPQMLALLQETTTRLGDSRSAALAAGDPAHPSNETLQLNLAEAYLTSGHAGKALAVLDKTTDDSDVRRDGLLLMALTAAQGPQAAGQEVQKLLAAHPRESGVLSIAGAYYASQGVTDRARTLLGQAIELDPGSQMAAIALARVEAGTGDLGAAQSTLQATLAHDPTGLPVRLALAGVLADEKAFDQAASLLNEIDPSQAGPDVQFALARVRLAQGDLKQADAAFDRAIAMRPGQAAIVEDAGSLLFAAKQYDAALARFAKATSLTPDNPAYWVNSARAQLALSQPAAARDSLQKAAKLRPNWLPVVEIQALMDVRDHKGQAALERAKALLASEPHDPGALILEGEVEAATGDLTDAMAAYASAQRQQPSAAVAVKEFQVTLAAHGAQPQKPLEEWLVKQPNDARVRYVLGNYYLQVHDLRPAAQAFQAVVRLAPNNVASLNNLAWLDEQLGEPQAEALAERAHQLAPQVPAVDDTLGWILARRGQASRAVPLLAQAVKLSPGDPDVQYHYAYALVRDGQRDQARQILSKLLASHASFDSQHDAEQLLAATRP